MAPTSTKVLVLLAFFVGATTVLMFSRASSSSHQPVNDDYRKQVEAVSLIPQVTTTSPTVPSAPVTAISSSTPSVTHTSTVTGSDSPSTSSEHQSTSSNGVLEHPSSTVTGDDSSTTTHSSKLPSSASDPQQSTASLPSSTVTVDASDSTLASASGSQQRDTSSLPSSSTVTVVDDSSSSGSSPTSEPVPWAVESHSDTITPAADNDGRPAFAEITTSNHLPVAWLILVHNVITAKCAPFLLRRVLLPGDSVFIHVDKKANVEVMSEMLQLTKNLEQQYPSVKFRVVSLRKAEYAKYTLCLAMVDLLRLAVDDSPTWKISSFLSGDTYPIQDLDVIRSRLEQAPIIRLAEQTRGPFRSARKDKWVSRQARDMVRPYMKFNQQFWFGTQWNVLSREAAEWILSDKSAQVLLKAMEFIHTPDEIYFQTALQELKSSPFSFNETWLRERYWDHHVRTNWEQDNKAMNKVFHLSDLDLIMRSGAMFARKVRHRDLRDAIDRAIANGDNPYPPTVVPTIKPWKEPPRIPWKL